LSKKESSRLAIGKVVKAFGIKGEVVVFPMTDSTRRFQRLRKVYLGKTATSAREIAITGVRIGSRGVRMDFEGIADRTSAEQLVGEFLFVDEQNRVVLPEGRYFIHELTGMAVIDQTGTRIGTLTDVLKMPASDVYVVDVNGREVMIPAVREFVKKIDVEAMVMVVHTIEGMVEGE